MAPSPSSPEVFAKHVEALGSALIAYTPEHFTSAFCIVEPAPGHANGRLRYSIGSVAFPDEGTSSPSEDVHAAANAMVAQLRRDERAVASVAVHVEQVGGRWKFRGEIVDATSAPRSEEEDEALWQRTYEARSEFFRTVCGGPLPRDIQKLMNLSNGAWPGGGLFVIPAPAVGGAITTSFGLTNFDMPTHVAVSEHIAQTTGDTHSFSSKVEARTPRFVPADLAGYGYEILIHHGSAEESWPLLPVSWFVQKEILSDIDLLDRVREMGGVTVEELSLGDGRTADFLVTPAPPPFPSEVALPNGTMQLLVATRITRDEMNFGREHGRPALRARLDAAGVGTRSDLSRRSVL